MLEELADNRADALEENGHIKKAKGVVRTSFPAEEKFATLFEAPRQPLVRSPSAFVTVQEGCDKFCTFCVVPYTRGAEVSRAAAEIEAEVVSLAQNGVSEITLLGQNVNAWLDVEEDDMGLGQLLRSLAQVDGIERLRYTTSHPRDMDDALIEAHADLPELMPYLHLPVQAGSDKILKAMNRKHTAEDYIGLVDRIRSARPDIALSSDFIVGFPGETEEDFTATLDLVKRVTYAQAYSFKYSPRPGTPASEEKQIAEDVKSERLARLQDVLNAQQVTFNASQKNETLKVLFEKQGKKVGQIVGRSPYLQTVHVDADETVIGRILPVKIEKAHANSLSGRISSI
jgi:tRNA-2-methylthio-N6-dimethylallyladenosine synthase